MADPLVLPIVEWTPDEPLLPSQGSDNIINVYPKTESSYGPVGAPARYSASALDARCQGAFGVIGLDDTVALFAGDAGKLYEISPGDALMWQDVSKMGGYTVDPEQQWEFEYFNGTVLATQISDPVQSFVLGSSTTFDDLSADAPKAKHISVVKGQFVVLGNTDDTVSGAQNQRVWWGAAGDATNWPTPGSTAAAQVQSGYLDLFGNVGAVQAIRAGLSSADGVVFQEYAVKRMMYSGPPDFFEFLPAQAIQGTPAPGSPVVSGGIAYYLGQEGWYAFDGSDAKAIGQNKIDKTFFADLAHQYFPRIAGIADPLNKMIMWIYPSVNSGDGTCDRLLMYHTALDRWTMAEITSEMLARMLTIGYTLDELYTVLGYTIDDLPAPLDSSIWQRGSLHAAIFDESHYLNFLTGPALAPRVDTSTMEVVPGRRFFIRNSRPLIDGGGTAPFVSITHRERIQDPGVTTVPVALNSMGQCPVRTSGRYFSASITADAGGDFTAISGVSLDGIPQGTR